MHNVTLDMVNSGYAIGSGRLSQASKHLSMQRCTSHLRHHDEGLDCFPILSPMKAAQAARRLHFSAQAG